MKLANMLSNSPNCALIPSLKRAACRSRHLRNCSELGETSHVLITIQDCPTNNNDLCFEKVLYCIFCKLSSLVQADNFVFVAKKFGYFSYPLTREMSWHDN